MPSNAEVDPSQRAEWNAILQEAKAAKKAAEDAIAKATDAARKRRELAAKLAPAGNRRTYAQAVKESSDDTMRDTEEDADQVAEPPTKKLQSVRSEAGATIAAETVVAGSSAADAVEARAQQLVKAAGEEARRARSAEGKQEEVKSNS